MLTPTQCWDAQYKGGMSLTNRKRHAAQVKTTLQRLRNECQNEYGGLHGVLSSEEIDQLTTACAVVDRIIAELEQDADAAKRIKTEYEKRVIETQKALQAAIPNRPANVVALLAIARDDYALSHLVENCKTRWGGSARVLEERYREAIAALAHAGARADKAAASVLAAVLGELEARRTALAPLITELNTIAVAHELERANRLRKAA